MPIMECAVRDKFRSACGALLARGIDPDVLALALSQSTGTLIPLVQNGIDDQESRLMAEIRSSAARQAALRLARIPAAAEIALSPHPQIPSTPDDAVALTFAVIQGLVEEVVAMDSDEEPLDYAMLARILVEAAFSSASHARRTKSLPMPTTPCSISR